MNHAGQLSARSTGVEILVGGVAFTDPVALDVQADAPLWFPKLDETSGTTMADSSGNGRNGTYVNSPTLGVPGLIGDGGSCATFNGTNQYGEVAFWSGLEGFTSFTLEAVIKGTGNGSVISRALAGTPYRIGVTSGKPFVAVRTTTAGETFCIGATSVNNNVRHHIAGRWTGSTLIIYVDGVQDGTTSINGTISSGGTSALRLAQRNSDSFYTGTVDVPALFGTDIGATRVAAHAAAM